MLQDLITQANEHVVKVNRLCKELEEFEGILHVADMEDSIVALGHNGNMTTYIGTVLSQEKMEELKRAVVMSLTEARISKENELEKLMGIRKPAVVNPVFEAAVQDMVKQNEAKAPGRKALNLDINQVKELYVNQLLPFRKVADQCGCSENAVRNFAMKNNITRELPVPADYPNMTVTEVRRVYTNGSMSLAEAAKYFGVESTRLHTFIEKNNLKKIVAKPNDPFLDSNKMDKEEFKRQMLAGRK